MVKMVTGKRYNCRICGRQLRILKSIFRGVGPICWKFGYMKRVFNKFVLANNPLADIEQFDIPQFVLQNKPCFGCQHFLIIHSEYDANLDKLVAKQIHKNVTKHIPEAHVRSNVMLMNTLALPGFCSECKMTMDGNKYSAEVQYAECTAGSEFEFKKGATEEVPEEE